MRVDKARRSKKQAQEGSNMLSRERLLAEHEELKAMAFRLLDCVERDRPEPDAIARLKSSTGRLLSLYMLKEDRLIFALMVERPSAAFVEQARQFVDAMNHLVDAYRDYLAEWTLDQIQRRWPEFQRATRAVVTALCQRIEHEEQVLSPLLPAQANGTQG